MVPTEKQLARTWGSSAGGAAAVVSKDAEAGPGLSSTHKSEASAAVGAGSAAAAVRALQLVRAEAVYAAHNCFVAVLPLPPNVSILQDR